MRNRSVLFLTLLALAGCSRSSHRAPSAEASPVALPLPSVVHLTGLGETTVSYRVDGEPLPHEGHQGDAVTLAYPGEHTIVATWPSGEVVTRRFRTRDWERVEVDVGGPTPQRDITLWVESDAPAHVWGDGVDLGATPFVARAVSAAPESLFVRPSGRESEIRVSGARLHVRVRPGERLVPDLPDHVVRVWGETSPPPELVRARAQLAACAGATPPMEWAIRAHTAPTGRTQLAQVAEPEGSDPATAGGIAECLLGVVMDEVSWGDEVVQHEVTYTLTIP